MSRWQSMLANLSGQRVTLSGWLFAVATVVVGVAAFASANNLLFLILAAMLATFLVSGFMSRLSLAGLELAFLHPEHISARRNVTGRIVVRNEKLWIPSFSVRLSAAGASGIVGTVLYYPFIAPNSELDQNVECRFPRRGRYTKDTFCFSTRFPFGFADRRIYVPVTQDILVYPSVEPRPGFDHLLGSVAGEIAARTRGRDGDFYRIRPYENFESARHVDWKATAHTGALQVREFARDPEPSALLFLDLEQPTGECFETSVEVAAFLAWNLAQRGARIRFRTQSFDLRCPEEGDAYTILKYLAEATPLTGQPTPLPDQRYALQIIVSPAASRLASAGWPTSGNGAFVVDPAALNSGTGYAITHSARAD